MLFPVFISDYLHLSVTDIGGHFSLDSHSWDTVILLQQGSALAGELVSTIPIRDNISDSMRA